MIDTPWQSICRIMKEKYGFAEVTRKTELADCKIDSLSRVEMAMEIEEAHDLPEIPDGIIAGWKNFGDIEIYVQSLLS